MHRTVYKALLFFFVFTLSHAQKTSLDKGRITTKTYYTEISYENVNGKLIIPVTINSKTYRFLFDTGAPNLITSELKKQLAFTSGNAISVSDANNARQQMEVITIPLFKLGDVFFKNTAALVYDGTDNVLFDCFHIDGIIGSNIFKKSVIQILSKEKLIILTNTIKKLNIKSQNASRLKLVGSQRSPYILVQLKDETEATEEVLFDSGANGFYDLCLRHYNTFEPRDVISTISEGQGANSIGLFGVAQSQTQYRVKIPQMTINGTVFKNTTTITESDDNSRIGSELLDYGNVTLDFKNKKFYFDAFKPEIDLEEKQFGFTPTLVDKTMVVGIVWDESLKERVKFGDEILSVNGINFNNIDTCDFITTPSMFKASDTLDISLKNSQGDIYKMQFERK